ncbi:unnamed protein product [Acanthocheilonema viteae]|uniref:Uncharacterized protein n=1 Tax=Acanthocheilonema viteae TaxID=6277 RepID=A0A498SFX2_ACAVI|nr:unnamed protein product [Acanthocheilonema viteae]
MNKLWKWFTGKRDECSVTYSRFGIAALYLIIRLGDILDDRPRPSTIYIAEFDDNDPKFIFFKLCHAQKAAAIVAAFGMSFIILIFISVFFEFDWYNHKTGIDIITLGFMLKAVCQCRYYLSCKEIHLTALKVAESSRTKYPGIHVIFSSPVLNSSYPVNNANSSGVADVSTIEQGINSSW